MRDLFFCGAFVVSVALLSAAAEARPNLLLSVTNVNLRTPLVVTVTGGSSGQEESIGRLGPRATTQSPYSLAVRNGTKITVNSALITGPNVDTQSFTINGQSNLSVQVDITQAQVLPEDSAANITKALSLMHYTGLPSGPRDSIVGSWLGAVVFYDAGDDNNKVLAEVFPEDLGNPHLTKADIQVGPENYNCSAKYTTDLSAAVTAAVPAIASLGFGTTANTLYETHCLLLQSGPMRPTKRLLSTADALFAVPAKSRSLVCNTLIKAAKDPRVIYISELYGITSVSGTISSTSANTTKGNVTGSAFVSGNFAYDTSKANITNLQTDPTVIGYNGADNSAASYCAAYTVKQDQVQTIELKSTTLQQKFKAIGTHSAIDGNSPGLTADVASPASVTGSPNKITIKHQLSPLEVLRSYQYRIITPPASVIKALDDGKAATR